MKLHGKIWKYGKNVDTDVIIPGRYVTITDPSELRKHCLEGLDPEFVRKISPGDMILADANFGCGSSREMAPIAIKAAKISCVIAVSFARIFYRNSINIGLPILESPEAYLESNAGDILEIDLNNGIIINVTQNKTFQTQPFPPFIQAIVKAGGLINKVKEELKKETKIISGMDPLENGGPGRI